MFFGIISWNQIKSEFKLKWNPLLARIFNKLCLGVAGTNSVLNSTELYNVDFSPTLFQSISENKNNNGHLSAHWTGRRTREHLGRVLAGMISSSSMGTRPTIRSAGRLIGRFDSIQFTIVNCCPLSYREALRRRSLLLLPSSDAKRPFGSLLGVNERILSFSSLVWNSACSFFALILPFSC